MIDLPALYDKESIIGFAEKEGGEKYNNLVKTAESASWRITYY